MPVSLTTVLDEIDPRRRKALIAEARRLPAEDADLQRVLDSESRQDKSGAKFRFEVYRDASGEFRFRFLASGGQTLLSSSESYASRDEAVAVVSLIKDFGAAAKVVG